jgi:catechol 2,3-dioxygenase
MMATDPLDLAALVRDAGADPWTGMPEGTVMGHVHLHVGDLAAASAFYSEALGFDRMVWQYPGAVPRRQRLPPSSEDQHLGGRQRAAPVQEAQLLEWTIELPDRASLDSASHSLASAGYRAEWDGEAGIAHALVTHDPWGTPLRLRSAAPAAPLP